MKIICLIDCLGAGGAQRQLVGLGSFLKEKNHDVEFLIYNNAVFYKDLLTNSGIKVTCIDNYKTHIGRFVKLSSYIIKQKPDWVVSFMEQPGAIAIFAKLRKFGNLNVLVSKRNTNLVCTLNERFYFNLFRIADIVTTNAYGEIHFFEQYFPKLAKKTEVIVNFVDLDYFNCNRSDINAKRKIIVAASISPSKNTERFIRAIKKVSETTRNFMVEWYGIFSMEDEYYKKCQALIEELEIQDVINLKPKTQNIRSKYIENDVFCLPSYFEGTPNALCEAMSCSMPIICSNVCENPLYVKEGVNGFLFEPENEDSIAKAVLDIISKDNDTLLQYGKNSRQFAEANFSKELFVEKYINLLK